MADSERTLDPDRLEAQVRQTPLAADKYLKTFIESLRSTGVYPFFRCFAGVLMARIDPWGNVYPCLEQHVRVGSVQNRSFRQVWQSRAFSAERQRLRTRRTCRCWYNNTALIGHYGRLLARTTCLGLGRQELATPVRGRPETSSACACAEQKPGKFNPTEGRV
jgi:MoaA/NifB/PqqE/SkfB family radical SAM enzyme